MRSMTGKFEVCGLHADKGGSYELSFDVVCRLYGCMCIMHAQLLGAHDACACPIVRGTLCMCMTVCDDLVVKVFKEI